MSKTKTLFSRGDVVGVYTIRGSHAIEPAIVINDWVDFDMNPGQVLLTKHGVANVRIDWLTQLS